MVTIPQLQRGKAVYGGGRFAPNVGKVSAAGAQGYLKRELNKKPGTAVFKQTTPKKPRPVKSAIKPKQPTKPTIGKPKTTRPGTPVHDTKTTTHPPTGPAPVAAPPTPQIVVRDDGTLELPYNQSFSQATLDALEQYQNTLQGINADQQQSELNFGQSMQAAQAAYTDQQRTTLNDASGRGLAFSSAYSTAVGNDATDYNRNINNLQSQHTLDQNNASSARANAIAFLQRTLNQAGLDNASDQQANAGDIGSSAANKPKPVNKPKPKPKKPTKSRSIPKKPDKHRTPPRPQAPKKKKK